MKIQNKPKPTWNILLFGIVLVAAPMLSSCSDDKEDNQSLPVVETLPVSNLTGTSASLGGTIKNSGSTKIRFSGLAFSPTNNQPTVTDDTTRTSIVQGTFTSSLESLTPSTTYYVRAYATNSIGTGYGAVVQFTTANGSPTATNLIIQGDVKVNSQLTASYSYNDTEGDPEGQTTLQWYVADNSSGMNEEAIANATSQTYTIQLADEGRYLRIGVIPKATQGTLTGPEIKSAFVGAVGEATTVTFDYNGESVTYNILNSPVTGRKWLDRNLGAKDQATSFDDYENYGDLFQWGREADGHQIVTRSGPSDAEVSGTETTTVASTDDTPGNNKFIALEEWRSNPNSNLWQGAQGTNNPCPSGWRIPRLEEWQAEGFTDLSSAYANLKITFTGLRLGQDANFYSTDLYGFYWTSTVPTGSTQSSYYAVGSSEQFSADLSRGNGLACRCIKE